VVALLKIKQQPMKILTIRFKNIHSLKGEHQIAFNEPPLRDAGLFAITGPTGAGKSTILDIITLALFNQVPRFERKITVSEIEKAGSVVTHHTSDAYAEVDYEAGGRLFRSTWSIAKTKKDNFKDYEMTLATLPESNFLDLKKSEVPAANERNIGLKYDQFVRSILLSQGEFARFLKSDEKDRALLLENITGTQIYRHIGKAAFEKAKTHRDHIQQLRTEINSIQILNEEDTEALMKQSELDRARVKVLQESLRIRQAQAEILNRIKLQENKLKQTQIQKSLQDQKEAAFKLKQEKIEKHENLFPFRQDILKERTISESIKRFNEAIDILKTKKQSTHEKTGILIRDAAVLSGAEISDQNLIVSLHSFGQKITALDDTLKSLKETGLSIRVRLNKLLSDSNAEIAEKLIQIQNPDHQKILVKERVAVLRQDHKVSVPGNDSALITQSNQFIRETDSLKNQLILCENLNTLKKETLQSEGILQEATKERDLLQQQEKRIREKAETLATSIAALKAEKERQFKITELESLRSDLIEGEPCPLCGSTEHPYHRHGVFSDYGKLSLELDVEEKKLKETQTELLKLTSEIAASSSKIELMLEQIHQKTNESARLLSLLLPEYHSMSAETMAEKLSILQQQHRDITKLIESRQELRFLNEVMTVIDEIAEATQSFKQKEQQRKSLYSGSDADDKINAILKGFEMQRNQSVEVSTSLEINEKDLAIALENIQQMQEKLLMNLPRLGYSSSEEAASDLLDDQQWQMLNQEKTALVKEAEQINTTLSDILAELDKLNKEKPSDIDAEALSDIIRTISNERDNLNIQIGATENRLKENESKKQALQLKTMKLNGAEKTAGKWIILDSYIGDATGSKYSKFAQQLSLQYLIGITNNRLKSLTDRYLLIMENAEQGELTISDLYLGGAARSVKTLSGGESFLVSLALALSLSDMASRNVKLESLFIDEGFGTLDPDSLEMALNTLEKLQSDSNKTIGIISHVDALKERIYTQVKVIRNSQGYSSIEITG
jgi:DNA repair protein SbcC/Rad50